MPGLSDLEERCVLPFYLAMMRFNVLGHPVAYAAVQEVGQRTSDEEVGWLLGAAWRPRVMGAWLAAGRMPRLAPQVLRSLETSAGSLTAPPLAVVALHGLGCAAEPALRTYLRLDLDQQHGCAGFIAAALERLDAAPDDVTVSDNDRATLDGMLAIADRLAHAAPTAPA